jgi:hypothetical protein
MAPLKADHSRSVDLGRHEETKKLSATATALKNNKPSHLAQESDSNSLSYTNSLHEEHFQDIMQIVVQSPKQELSEKGKDSEPVSPT